MEQEITCSLFGHRDTPCTVKAAIRTTLLELVEERHVSRFLVGHNGAFDRISVLREIKNEYPHIEYRVVLYRIPGSAALPEHILPEETLFPEGLENVPPRIAIVRRNQWMVRESDIVAAYALHHGGASNAVSYARRTKKEVVRIAA